MAFPNGCNNSCCFCYCLYQLHPNLIRYHIISSFEKYGFSAYNMPGTVLSVDPVLGVGYAKGHIEDNIN